MVHSSGPFAELPGRLPEVVLPVVRSHSPVPERVRGGFSRGLLPLWGLLLALEPSLLLLVCQVSLKGSGHVPPDPEDHPNRLGRPT